MCHEKKRLAYFISMFSSRFHLLKLYVARRILPRQNLLFNKSPKMCLNLFLGGCTLTADQLHCVGLSNIRNSIMCVLSVFLFQSADTAEDTLEKVKAPARRAMFEFATASDPFRDNSEPFLGGKVRRRLKLGTYVEYMKRWFLHRFHLQTFLQRKRTCRLCDCSFWCSLTYLIFFLESYCRFEKWGTGVCCSRN